MLTAINEKKIIKSKTNQKLYGWLTEWTNSNLAIAHRHSHTHTAPVNNFNRITSKEEEEKTATTTTENNKK